VKYILYGQEYHNGKKWGPARVLCVGTNNFLFWGYNRELVAYVPDMVSFPLADELREEYRENYNGEVWMAPDLSAVFIGRKECILNDMKPRS
jgi:hypothetical protein